MVLRLTRRTPIFRKLFIAVNVGIILALACLMICDTLITVLNIRSRSTHIVLRESKNEDRNLFANYSQGFQVVNKGTLATLEGDLQFVNRSLTARYWDLFNESSRGAKNTKGIFTESKHLPNLWRPERKHLSQHDDRVLAQLILATEAKNLSTKSKFNKMKVIYLFDYFNWWGKRGMWKSPHVLDDRDCPGNPEIFKKCTFTENRNASFNAVIMARTHMHNRNIIVPPDVLKFYYILESPLNSFTELTRSNDLLATFYRGSDINTPYAKWVYYNPSIKFKDQNKNYAEGKTKMAAIFVSNCFAPNDRLTYVRQLQKYVDVDVYGKCGRQRCFQTTGNACSLMLKQIYRFYLSFENSNCRDYITEKLFQNAYENDVIPIVMGAHPADYKAMCPEKSYIHVENFSNPKELAKYMIYLAQNPEEYNSYFRWKDTGTFVNTHFFCRICAMVHYADIVPPPERKVVHKWGPKSAVNSGFCLQRKNWYWTLK